MPTTAKGLRYPTSADTVDIAGDIQNLATDIESVHAAQTYSLTSKGSLPTRSASAYAVHAPIAQPGGLRALASASTGLEWGAYPAGGWSLISTTTTTQQQAIIPVLNIPLGFKQIAFAFTGSTGTNSTLELRINPEPVSIVSTASDANNSRITITTSAPHGLVANEGAIIVSNRAQASGQNVNVQIVHSATVFTIGSSTNLNTLNVVAAAPGDYVMNPGLPAPSNGNVYGVATTANSGAGAWTRISNGTAQVEQAFTSTSGIHSIYGFFPEPFTAGIRRKIIVRGTHPAGNYDGTGLLSIHLNTTGSVAGITFESNGGSATPFVNGAQVTVWGLK